MIDQLRPLFRFSLKWLAVGLLLGFAPIRADDTKQPHQLSGSDIAYFENKIRPLLVEHCYECHSAQSKDVGGGLLLDSKDAILRGGESGPALIAGQPEKSLIIQALEFQEVEMPPSGQLPVAVINEFKKWVRKGAPDPRGESISKSKNESAAAADPDSLWSFQPRVQSQLPTVRDPAWPIDPLDRFILSRLEQENLAPVKDASPDTLCRRIFYDLTGLPPTLSQLQGFQARYRKHRQRAIEELVDQLLASPEFGIRWGQHWLDVARYGESNGDDGLGRNASFPHAWRYRDYVVESLNRDVPYDRFLIEQIAGDTLPAKSADERNRNLIATGFLALGAKPAAAMNNNFAMDVVDDQINAVCTTVLGLSVACARCHDHKHDPVSMKDYYALAGIFSSTETLYGLAANEKLTAPATPLHTLVSQLPSRSVNPKQAPKFPATYPATITKLKPAVYESLQVKPETFELVNQVNFDQSQFASFSSTSGLKGSFSRKTDAYSASFWFRNNTPNNSRPITVYLFSRGQFGDKKLLGDHLGIGGTHDKTGTGKLFVFNGNVPNKKSVKGHTVIQPGTWNHVVLVREQNRVRVYLNGSSQPEIDSELANTVKESREFCLGQRADAFAPLQGSLAHVAVFDRALNGKEANILHAASGQPKGVKTLGLAMGVRDRAKPSDAKVHINGSRAKLGKVVPRGTLSIYTDQQLVHSHGGTAFQVAIQPGPQASGRRELADWLVQPDHPQTARVMVNRIWLHLFGRGLVETPDDFGVYGARPSHPELLDHLANRFVEEGWSIKNLIRTLILSRTYRLASSPSTRAVQLDPDNVLYSFHSRRRLDAEEIRDTILHASGQLDWRPGQGSAIDQTVALINWPIGNSTNFHRPSNHRSLYLCRLRHAPPRELVAFDLPDGIAVTGQRDVTVKPTQSLFFMNDPFVIKQSQLLAGGLLERHASDVDRVTGLHQQILKRSPTRAELTRSLEFVKRMRVQLGRRSSSSPGKETESTKAGTTEKEMRDLTIEQAVWASLTQALFSVNEFRFVD